MCDYKLYGLDERLGFYMSVYVWLPTVWSWWKTHCTSKAQHPDISLIQALIITQRSCIHYPAKPSSPQISRHGHPWVWWGRRWWREGRMNKEVAVGQRSCTHNPTTPSSPPISRHAHPWVWRGRRRWREGRMNKEVAVGQGSCTRTIQLNLPPLRSVDTHILESGEGDGEKVGWIKRWLYDRLSQTIKSSQTLPPYFYMNPSNSSSKLCQSQVLCGTSQFEAIVSGCQTAINKVFISSRPQNIMTEFFTTLFKALEGFWVMFVKS